jgi:hypothetical protein
LYLVNVTHGSTLCTAGKSLSIGAKDMQIRKLAGSTNIIDLSD